jgi:hypothetical protein
VSTLTKVLVVLLTLSAIFLCGIVVTYAASAANYKLKHDDAMTENKSLSANATLLQSQLNEGLKAKQDEIASLQDQLNKLVADNGKLQSEALTLKAAKDELQERVNGWSGTMQKNTLIVADLQQQLATTRTELDKLRNDLVTNSGKLTQASAALEDKTLQLKSLERENMRLVEEKTALENKFNGRPSARTTVTAPVGSIKPASGSTPKIVLQGRINEVRMDSMLASINIGSANGVKVGDTLHVIRGDQFVCSIYITNVDTDSSAGQITTLKVGLQPQQGDMVTNKL